MVGQIRPSRLYWTNMAHDDDTLHDQAGPAAGTEGKPLTDTERFLRAKEIFESRSYEGEELRMGQVLRRVREVKGLELQDVSTATLLRRDYLMWIERMEVGELPKRRLPDGHSWHLCEIPRPAREGRHRDLHQGMRRRSGSQRSGACPENGPDRC
jgi:hypothetical protein